MLLSEDNAVLLAIAVRHKTPYFCFSLLCDRDGEGHIEQRTETQKGGRR
ncbi:MAG TPA: hypothetical protein VGX03_38020 [Candidatus Binatia bacterium]|nr:hypothetical protein [Candidatus Binatia bacterium]